MINHRRDKSGPYRNLELLAKEGWKRLVGASILLCLLKNPFAKFRMPHIWPSLTWLHVKSG